MLSPEEKSSVIEAVARIEQRVSRELETKSSAWQAIEFFGVLHANIDKLVQAESATAPQPDCKPGCAYCCSVRVEVSEPEALRIARYIATLSEQEAAALTSELQVRADFHRQQDANPSARMACAFLRDNLCSIYALRPATCRKAHSLSVQACASYASEIPQKLSLLLGCEALVTGTKNAFRTRDLPVSSMELSAAVLAALASDEAVELWYRGESLRGDEARPDVDDGSL
jgi:Fe-S-cluster containining protein